MNYTAHDYVQVKSISDIDISKIELGTPREHTDDSNFSQSIPILYEQCPLQIQTPWLDLLFGLQTYQYEEGMTRFSLCLNLDPVDDQVEKAIAFFNYIDAEAQTLQNMNETDYQYFSAIRPPTNPKFDPHLRVKIGEWKRYQHERMAAKLKSGDITREKYLEFIQTLQLNVDLDTGDKVIRHPTVQVLSNYCKHRTKIRCLLKVNPIWYNKNKKFGVSYRVTKIQIGRYNKEFK